MWDQQKFVHPYKDNCTKNFCFPNSKWTPPALRPAGNKNPRKSWVFDCQIAFSPRISDSSDKQLSRGKKVGSFPRANNRRVFRKNRPFRQTPVCQLQFRLKQSCPIMFVIRSVWKKLSYLFPFSLPLFFALPDSQSCFSLPINLNFCLDNRS